MSEFDAFPRELRNVDISIWLGDIPVGHKYTMGVAGDVFFRNLRDAGELTASVYEGSDTAYLPPQIFCPETLAPVKRYKKVGPNGTIDTFTIVHRGRDSRPLKEPRALAMIKIDGAEGGILHWIGGCPLEKIHIGMRVKAVFEPKSKRKGSLNDIRHFAPLKK
jgi:uncharacterized OB-fold protein